MKMTPLLWRVVSVLLCVAVVCWYTKGYVVSVESHQQAQRPVSSQDVGSQEESGEKIHDRKFEDSWPLPASSPSEHEPVMEDDQQTARELDTKQHAEAPEGEEPDVEVESEADKGIPQSELETEQSSENQHPEASTIQNQDSSSLLPSHDPLPCPAAALRDPPDILNLQDDVPKSVPEAASQVLDSDLPPADCEDENNPYESESSPPKVLENTSNVHTAGTKAHTDLPPPPPQSSSTNHSPQHLEANASHMLKEQDLSSPVTADADSSASGKDPEDIPTFDEWKRKVMEVEKEKTQSVHTSNNGVSPPVKKIQKNFNNYASVECGAKILGANPEAKSTSAILKENMDLYMLNPCSNKIWFVIELCEPIQVKQLDIANFELFSSTPKDFLVSISDRYPTNKWLKLGTFHARDERTVQSFPLDEHLYAKYVKMFTKYIKVELLSHFGSEHFCPLSLIRVFGTSMVEEYEEIADPPERPDDQDEELDYPPGYATGEAKLSNNLIGSAKDVILNMVNNIAVNVLGGGPEVQGNLSSHEVNATEPPPQLETTSKPTSPVPESEEKQVKPEPEVPAAEAPSPETPVPESPTSDEGEQELPPVEEKIIIPLGKDEEEPISSTITLLEEEDLDEGKEKWEQETQTCSKPNPSCSSCSGAPSLQEYLHQRCSALLSNEWTCQTKHSKPMIPSIQTPVWHTASPPSGHPGSHQPHSEAPQPHERAPASEQHPGGGASSAVPSDLPQNTVASHEESVSNSPPLEPSQTTNLPKPSTSDSSGAEPTPVIETPQLSSETPRMSLDQPAEEKHVEPSGSLSSSVEGQPGAGAPVEPVEETSGTGTSRPPVEPVEETSGMGTSRPQIPSGPVSSTETPDGTDQLQSLHPTTSSHVEHPVDPSAVLQTGTPAADVAPPSQEIATELEPSCGHSVVTDTKSEELSEDISASSSPPPAAPASSPSLSDIYADPPNDTEQNGNPVHGSSQKESVFMRLNNRIKALEMNMSLSGRYLEQLSQRYRKQMEEMQKAFNKTIVKLQNTSRIAEEQDQRQTESIQSLQGQLENMTQLVLNLSIRVVQLQDEVTDRQNYLLLSLAFILCLGLLLWANYRRAGNASPTTQPKPPLAKSHAHCCPDRQLTSCEEAGLRRSASYPLIHGESFQLAAAEGPGMLPEDVQGLCPANRKRRRRKVKPVETVETLKPSLHAAPELCNGGLLFNGTPVTRDPAPLTSRLLQPLCRNSPSEGSSEGSSQSDDPSFCGMTAACGRICEGLPAPTSQPEKRASRRRRPKPGCTVVDLRTAPRRDRRELLPAPSFCDMASRTSEQRSGTFGATVVL